MTPLVGGTIAITGVHAPMYNKLVKHSGITPALPIVPDLAYAWNLSPDGTVWTFSLRQGVKFHDNSDFDAEDVKASFDRMIFPPEGLQSENEGRLGKISEVNVIDSSTVEMKQSAFGVPLAAFAAGACVIVSKDALDASNGDLREVEYAPGTGPWMHLERNDERWIQQRWDGYWKPGTPHPDFIEHIWLIYQTPENDAALRSGIVDWAQWITPKLGEGLRAGDGPAGLLGIL